MRPSNVANFNQQKVSELQQSFLGAIKKLLESFFCEYSEASKYILIDCWIVLSHSSSNCQHTHWPWRSDCLFEYHYLVHIYKHSILTASYNKKMERVHTPLFWICRKSRLDTTLLPMAWSWSVLMNIRRLLPFFLFTSFFFWAASWKWM